MANYPPASDRFTGGSVAGYAGEAATAPRELRALETLLNSARTLLEHVNSNNGSLDELRHRLLGLSDPKEASRPDKEPAVLVRAELAELGTTLERLHAAMQSLSSKVADLHRI